MARAQLITKLGTKVSIEGTVDEVADLLARFEGEHREPKSTGSSLSMLRSTKPSRSKKAVTSPANLISEFTESGFFSTPKDLNAIKVALQEQGHFYPATSLSPTLLRLVRKRQLRRMKDNKRWVYVA
jgi:hypothetical protein